MIPNNFFKEHTYIAIDVDETLAQSFSLILQFAHSQ